MTDESEADDGEIQNLSEEEADEIEEAGEDPGAGQFDVPNPD